MLAKARETKKRGGDRLSLPVLAGAIIYKGALVVLEGTACNKGHTDTGLVALGVAENSVSNPDGGNDVLVDIRRDGLFHFKNDDADPITIADLNTECFIKDDETVSKTNGTNTRSVAGIIRDVADGGVWIEFK